MIVHVRFIDPLCSLILAQYIPELPYFYADRGFPQVIGSSANQKLAMPVGQLVFQCEIRIRARLYEACISADALVDSEAIGLPGAVD
jgi:hypothetical protein